MFVGKLQWTRESENNKTGRKDSKTSQNFHIAFPSGRQCFASEGDCCPQRLTAVHRG